MSNSERSSDASFETLIEIWIKGIPRAIDSRQAQFLTLELELDLRVDPVEVV